MANLKISAKETESIYKLEVNEMGETIDIVLSDVSFIQKFAELVAWMNATQEELKEKETELENKYEGKSLVDEQGEYDIEQLTELIVLNKEFNQSICDKFEELFGQDLFKKYFRKIYNVIPDYVPDGDAILDFVEQIVEVINTLYGENIMYKADRNKRLGKYKPQDHKKKAVK